VEKFRGLFGPDAIIAWHFKSFRRNSNGCGAGWPTRGAPRVLRFTRTRDLDAWLDSLEPADRDHPVT